MPKGIGYKKNSRTKMSMNPDVKFRKAFDRARSSMGMKPRRKTRFTLSPLP